MAKREMAIREERLSHLDRWACTADPVGGFIEIPRDSLFSHVSLCTRRVPKESNETGEKNESPFSYCFWKRRLHLALRRLKRAVWSLGHALATPLICGCATTPDHNKSPLSPHTDISSWPLDHWPPCRKEAIANSSPIVRFNGFPGCWNARREA
jgi:hypothetical protein